jgi:hypothetical protein
MSSPRAAAERGVQGRRVPGLERGRHHLLADVQVLPELGHLLRLRRPGPAEREAARAGVVRPHPVARRRAEAGPVRPVRVPAVGPPPRARRLHGRGGRAAEPQLSPELLHVREVRRQGQHELRGAADAPVERHEQRQIHRERLTMQLLTGIEHRVIRQGSDLAAVERTDEFVSPVVQHNQSKERSS